MDGLTQLEVELTRTEELLRLAASSDQPAVRREVALREAARGLEVEARVASRVLLPHLRRAVAALDPSAAAPRAVRAQHDAIRGHVRALARVHATASPEFAQAVTRLLREVSTAHTHARARILPILRRYAADGGGGAGVALLAMQVRLARWLAPLMGVFWPNPNGSRPPFDRTINRLLVWLSLRFRS